MTPLPTDINLKWVRNHFFFCLDLLSCGVGLFGVLFTTTSMPRTLLILCLCSNTLAGCSASVCLHVGCCEQSVLLAASGADLAGSLLLGTLPDSRDVWQRVVDRYCLSALLPAFLSVFLSTCLSLLCMSAFPPLHLPACLSVSKLPRMS